MPTWRPKGASDPDGQEEHEYEDLQTVEPDLHAHLLDRFGRQWLALAGLDSERLGEVGDTVELVIHRSTRVLRIRSWYTGQTYWGPEWDGQPESADEWIDDVADLIASNVKSDRGRFGATPWDRP